MGHLGGPHAARVTPGQVLVVLAEQALVDELGLTDDAVDPGALGQHVEVRPEGGALPGPLAALGVLEGGPHGLPQVVVDAADHGGEDLRLGPVVGVEAARGHPGPGTDVGDRRPVIAALAEKLLRRRQQQYLPVRTAVLADPGTGRLCAPPSPARAGIRRHIGYPCSFSVWDGRRGVRVTECHSLAPAARIPRRWRWRLTQNRP